METAFLSSVPDASTSRVSTAHSSALHAKIRRSVFQNWCRMSTSDESLCTRAHLMMRPRAAQLRSAFRLFGSISRVSVFCTCHLFFSWSAGEWFLNVELFKRFRFLSAFFVRNLCILIRSRHRWSCTVVLPRVRLLRAEQIWNELEKMSCFHFTLEYKEIKIT